MENQLKDEQIRNQAEAIQSLERKIETLEAQLPKHLDPDIGEINPAVRLHGEKALVDQVQTLEKQLTECLDMSVDLPETDDLQSRIYHSLHGLFLPTKKWSEYHKEYQMHTVPWWYLREFLFDVDLFNDNWSSADFRKGASILNDIILVLDSSIRESGTADLLERMETHEFGNRLFGWQDAHAEEMHRGTQSLISALVLIRNNQEHPVIKGAVLDSDLVDMLVILKAVAFFQRLWMDAKPQPQMKEAEQKAK